MTKSSSRISDLEEGWICELGNDKAGEHRLMGHVRRTRVRRDHCTGIYEWHEGVKATRSTHDFLEETNLQSVSLPGYPLKPMKRAKLPRL